jgi:orotate phosphoribosyltransferase
MIFKTGNFILASGLKSNFKIDCDDLTEFDLHSLALYAKDLIPKFKEVYGVPTGGLRFANQMKKFKSNTGNILVIDDVFTTGKSITEFINDNELTDVQGLVIFARNQPFDWIKSIFTMTLPTLNNSKVLTHDEE